MEGYTLQWMDKAYMKMKMKMRRLISGEGPSLLPYPITLGRSRWSPATDCSTIFFSLYLCSAALCEASNFMPLYLLVLPACRFPCLPRLLSPCTVPSRMGYSRPELLVAYPYHVVFLALTMVCRSLRGPTASAFFAYRPLHV